MDVNDRAATKIVLCRLIPVPDSVPEYKLIFALEPVQRNRARFSKEIFTMVYCAWATSVNAA